MMSLDHRYILSFNGELYNFREIRSELKRNGYWFRSQTDSEVVLNAFSLWGLKSLSKFNGMFALALWDRKEKTLLLARDRYGIKPLYFSKQNETFSFASEQKAILAQASFTRKLNKSALVEYFTFQNIFTSNTFFEDIHLLPAGHFMEINPENIAKQNFEPECYWDFHFAEPTKVLSDNEYEEELERLFTQAVNRQLVSDVRLAPT